MKCPRCQQDNPSHAKFCLECGAPVRRSAGDDASQASYTELQRSLAKAVARESAIGEILQVIGSSPTDVQPVFDAIARNARRLLHGYSVAVTRLVGDELQLMSYNTTSLDADAVMRAFHPIRLERVPTAARTVRERTPAVVSDIEIDPAATEEQRDVARARGFRSFVYMPMVRDDVAIGVIAVTRQEPGGFTDGDLTLLKTFADQAVIAIENVRLFTELQEKNRALTQAHAQVTEALEQQTATSEILRVISGSPTDVQPVFDTVAANAVTLCQAQFCHVFRFDGTLLHIAAQYGLAPEGLKALQSLYPAAPGHGSAAGRSLLSRDVEQIPDINADADYRHRGTAAIMNYRSIVAVPMLRDGVPVGCIVAGRSNTGSFPERLVRLLQTFADQAVIAIENVRLFKELEARTTALTRSVEQLTALGEVGRAVSSTLDLPTVLDTILTRANVLAGTDGGAIYEFESGDQTFHLRRAAGTFEDEFVAVLRANPLPLGEGVVGRAGEQREPVQIPDIRDPKMPYDSRVREAVLAAGYRALLAVPLLSEEEVIGALVVNRRIPGEFDPAIVEILRTFATQSALAIQNARLFREIEQKSRELEAASRHKSEFLANMSHELRTPLNAVIGFSEVLSERMFGELNEKQDEYLKDIHASGQHLLSLINDILDLSKIEAGRMDLEVTDFDLPMAIDNALTLIRERAARRSIALHTTVDERLGQIQGDERKVRQVLLNLLSNAIKFTPEGGRIEVGAKPVNGSVEVSVTDTGVGIAPEDQEAVFEEFKQVGTADKKVEGTGLGLALSRKFIELHGGRIWVKSQVGAGSTFTFTIPVSRGQ